MAATERRTLWLHGETPKALLVSADQRRERAEDTGAWIPRSQITELSREPLRHPDGDDRPRGAALWIGMQVTIEAPVWLLKKKGLAEDAVWSSFDET